VPDARSREGIERMTQRAKEALDSGISLIAFAEGSRTRDGHVKRFHRGVFRLAQRFGAPIVPMSIVGSYQFFQTGNWMLHPGKITVHLHDTIDTSQVERADIDQLAERVRNIVAGPVEESLKSVYTTSQASGSAPSGS
jgi:1-acyl-sn-glycerol-3-phosphate acyltransferase